MPSVDLTEFWTRLWASGAKRRCPSCGGTEWGDEFLTALPDLDAPTPANADDDEEEGLIAVALVCVNCHSIRLHATPLRTTCRTEATVPPVDRKNPVRSKSSDSTYSLMEFMQEFPDDDACLEWLWRNRFSEDGRHADCPKCGREGVLFKKYATAQRRQTWTCTKCGHHVQPTAGTIFEGSSTSLHLWFYALHLMTSTRCGISAKQLERELGVTYKTAWRMFNLIRNELMADDDEPLSGEVEIDETSVEGRPRVHMDRSAAARFRERSRATVVAAVERGGRVKATILPSRRGPEIREQIIEWINPDAVVYTDEWPAYNFAGDYFAAHSRVRHSSHEYVRGDWHTNTVEGFFGNLKTGLRGNYKKVSRRWLQGYLNEFVWRYNHRHSERAMFKALLLRATNG